MGTLAQWSLLFALGLSVYGGKAYFVERYGEWILLVPPARGFSLLAWVAPLLGLGGGLAGAVFMLTRWVRRSSGITPLVDAAYVACVRLEVEERRHDEVAR